MDPLPSNVQTLPNLPYTDWCTHIPHVGFDYDRVIAYCHKPLPRRISALVHTIARPFGKTVNRPANILHDMILATMEVLARSHEQTVNEIADTLEDAFGETVEDIKAIAAKIKDIQTHMHVPSFFGRFSEDYGHVCDIFRHNGRPVAIYENARAVGFYPKHLCLENIGGMFMYRDRTLQSWQRAVKTLAFETPMPGGLSNDDHTPIVSCAIFQLSPLQAQRAAHAVREAAAHQYYHAFAEKAPNCVVINGRVTAKMEIDAPPEFRDSKMPKQIKTAIEHYAGQGPFKSGTKHKSAYFVSAAEMEQHNMRCTPEPFAQNFYRAPPVAETPTIAAMAYRVARVASFGALRA